MPTPFDESTCPDKFWPPREPWNDLVRRLRPSFITDFVYASRGVHSPTPFAVWTALTMIAAIVRRYAWLDWYPDKFYPNLYTLLVAMPALCGKSTMIDSFADKILSDYHSYIANPVLAEMRMLPIFRDKITPEAIFKVLQNRQIAIPTPAGGHKFRKLSADAMIIASDLPTLLGKQKYNEGILGLLTRAYDCPQTLEYTSSGKGTLKAERTYLTILGGATRDSISSSVPQETFGEGFMSRLIPMYVGKPTRGYSEAIRPIGAPSIEDLKKRLAWISINASGEFKNTDAANLLWQKWHTKFFEEVARAPESYSDMRSRLRVTVKKLSLLIRLSRYEPSAGNAYVDEQDLQEAIDIVEGTYKRADAAIERVGESEYHRKLRRLENVIASRKVADSRQLTQLTRIAKGTGEMQMMLQQLVAEGRIEVYREGELKERVTGKPREEYKWVEGLRPRG